VNALILAGTMAAALVGGWYGRSVLGRIRHWGEKMNEIDELYQSVASPEEMAGQVSSSRAGGVTAAAGGVLWLWVRGCRTARCEFRTP